MESIHAFAQEYWKPMYLAAERLTDEELERRINMYENKLRSMQEREERRHKSLIEKIDDGDVSPLFIPLVFVSMMIGLSKMLYRGIFPEMPLIFDGVNPLVDPEDAYCAAVQVRDFRRKEEERKLNDKQSRKN